MVLEGKVAVVTGATGIVGEGIARAFLEAGSTLVCPIRRLDCPVDDYATAEGAKQLARYVQLKYGAVDHVVACTGGMVALGPLTAVTAAGFNQAMHDRVLGQIVLAQALLPLLREDPAAGYTVITGRLGELCTMPDGALFCVSNAAVYGVVVALQGEFGGRPQRINELRIGAVVRRDGEEEHPHFPGVKAHPASLVGAEALKIAAGSVRGEVVRLYLD